MSVDIHNYLPDKITSLSATPDIRRYVNGLNTNLGEFEPIEPPAISVECVGMDEFVFGSGVISASIEAKIVYNIQGYPFGISLTFGEILQENSEYYRSAAFIDDLNATYDDEVLVATVYGVRNHRLTIATEGDLIIGTITFDVICSELPVEE